VKTLSAQQKQIEAEQRELLKLLEMREQELHYNKKNAIFPDTGPFRRELYPEHIKFINASVDHSQLAFIAANRVGKTLTGAYIMACHLTGDYPEWWEGIRFKNAIDAWAAGKTNQKTKEIVQKELLGPENDIGSGMIPRDKIIRITKKPGVADAVETVTVQHSSGGVSVLEFKSYEQGRDGFEGTKRQVIWLDEEPADARIYSECLMRLADRFRPGIIYCTFTPLEGLSTVVLSFLPEGKIPRDGTNPRNTDMFVVQVTWDDVPHLTDSDKKRLWDGCLPHERSARSKGIPSLGAGAIYPYDEDDILIDPIPIKPWWPRAYGMDTGWNRTACVWGALDPDTGIFYLYSELYNGKEVPAINASAIRGRGNWITGACDPDGVNQADGVHIFDLYENEGLNLVKADKRNVDAGIFKVCQMIESGQLKVFRTLHNWISEFRTYHRDDDGKIVKKNDHIMDAMRYLIFTGMDVLELPPGSDSNSDSLDTSSRDSITGY